MLNHGVLVGERWNDETARLAYEAAGGRPASTGAQVEGVVASCAQREIMLNHGVLVGERWNDETARLAYEAAGGRPASTGAQVEGAQTGETAMAFADPTKAAKTGA